MTDKTFSVGGVSKSKSGYKVRFATDMTRVKILAKTDTDVNLIELPKAMTKPELVSFLKTSELYLKAEYKEAIDAADAKYNDAGTVRVNAGKPSMDDIKSRAKSKQAA
jgi:hypothetical protein